MKNHGRCCSLFLSLLAIVLFMLLPARWAIADAPLQATPADILVTLDEAGYLTIRATAEDRPGGLTLEISSTSSAIIVKEAPASFADQRQPHFASKPNVVCQGIACHTSGPNQVRLRRTAISGNQVRFEVGSGRNQLVLGLPKRGETFDLALAYSGGSYAVRLATESSLNLISGELAGPLAVELNGAGGKILTAGPLLAESLRVTGSDEDDLIFNGPLTVRNEAVVAAGAVILNAPLRAPGGFTVDSQTFTLNPSGAIEAATGSAILQAKDRLTLRGSRLYAAQDLNLSAGHTVHIRDSATQPFVAQAGGRFDLQGNYVVDIFALAHPASALISGGDMTLRSAQAIRGDAHYRSGGRFRLEALDGQAGNLISPYDPIIFANGDVTLADYTGASLHILAGGSVTLGNVEITGPDTGPNSINPGNTATFNGVDPIASLAPVTLSNGTTGVINGSITPTLDIRAGIDWNTFQGGPPADQVIPPVINPTFSGVATSAAITITGNITISAPAGQVLLTNQYRPNNSLDGDITSGNINAGTTQPQTNGGSIAIDSRGDISTGNLFTFADVAGEAVIAGDAGNIAVLALNGAITSSGDLSAFSRTPVNSLGSAGNGGFIVVVAANGITIENGTGAVETYAFSNQDGDAGNGGAIGLTTINGDLTVGPLRSFVRAFGGDVGSAGDVTLDADQGVISIGSDFFTSIDTSALGITPDDAGTVTATANFGINAASSIRTHVSGFDGNAGNINLFTVNGDITTGSLLAGTAAGNGGSPGNGGNVALETLEGGITTGDVDSLSLAFFINNDARDGGDILMRANGDITTGPLRSFSEARGAQGDAGLGGNISLAAINGSVNSSGSLLAYSLSAINNGASGTAQNGGEVRLQALNNVSVTGRIDAFSEAGIFGNAVISGTATNGGTVALTATTGSILIADNISSYANAELDAGNGGSISLNAGSGIEINNGAGSINAYAQSQEGSVGNGGNVSLDTASGDINLAMIDTRAFNPFADNATATGNGGAINLNSGNGAINLSGNQIFLGALQSNVAGPDLTGNAGDISLTATQDIVVGQAIRSSVNGIDGNGGNIQLLTSGGDITVGELHALATFGVGGSPGNGGNVSLLTLQGNITTQDINTFSNAFVINNDSRNGGSISLQAPNGAVAIGLLQSYSEARGLLGDTGNAGPVEIFAGSGGLTIAGDVAAYSLSAINNNNSGLAANGGNILLQASDLISVSGGLRAFSAATGPNGQASASGDVNLAAGNDIELSYIDARAVDMATNGQGGIVEVTTGQFFRATNIISNALFPFVSNASISTEGLPNTSAITITHGGNGLTPFIIGDPATNGTAGPITSGDAAITPTTSFPFTHFEPPNIWIISVPLPLTITKTAIPSTDAPFRGEITYSIDISNPTTVEANGVLFTDTLPVAVNFDRFIQQPGGASVTPGPPNQITWTGPVSANQAVNFTYVVSHTGDYSDVLTNTAQIFHPNSEAAGAVAAQVVVAGPPLLSISKTANPDVNVPFQGQITYSIIISNAGPSDAVDTVFTDTLPGEVSFARFVEQPGGALVSAGPPDQITWTGTVTANQAVTFTFVASHTGNFGDAFINTAEFFHPLTNQTGSATALVSIEGSPVLSIAKTAEPNTDVTYHGEVTYTITLANTGISNANNTLLTDTLPLSTTFARWVVQPAGAIVAGDELTWNGTVTASETVTFTFVVSHTGDYGDVVTNTAEYSHISSSGSTQAAFTVEPIPTTDLFISKSSIRDQANGVINYTIVVQNLGPSDADGAVVSDTMPTGISAFSWQCSASGGATCTPTGTGDLNDTLTSFPAGSQVIYSVVATLVNPDVTVVNVATILAPPDVINTAPTNSASDTSRPFETLFLPVILNTTGDFVPGPDLVVESLVADSNAVTVTIKNVGDAPVVDGFWVDVYLNPATAPTAVNQRWQDLGSQGLVWGVVEPSIAPNQSITLTINDPAYFPDQSNFVPPLPVASVVYAQVDSVNLLTDYGGVLESHEISGGDYNNITEVVSGLASPNMVTANAVRGPKPASLGDLPLR